MHSLAHTHSMDAVKMKQNNILANIYILQNIYRIIPTTPSLNLCELYNINKKK